MVQEVEAVYESGVLRPLTPIDLGESETVHLRISTNAAASTLALEMIESARAEIAGTDIPTLEEVRRMLSVIPGNWSDDIIAERGEY